MRDSQRRCWRGCGTRNSKFLWRSLPRLASIDLLAASQSQESGLSSRTVEKTRSVLVFDFKDAANWISIQEAANGWDDAGAAHATLDFMNAAAAPRVHWFVGRVFAKKIVFSLVGLLSVVLWFVWWKETPKYQQNTELCEYLHKTQWVHKQISIKC